MPAVSVGTGVGLLQRIVHTAKQTGRVPFASLDLNSPVRPKLRPRLVSPADEPVAKRTRFAEAAAKAAAPAKPPSPVKPPAKPSPPAEQPAPRAAARPTRSHHAPAAPAHEKKAAATVSLFPEALDLSQYGLDADDQAFLFDLLKSPVRRPPRAPRADAAPRGGGGRAQPRLRAQALGDDLSQSEARHFPLPLGDFGFGDGGDAAPTGIFACNARWQGQYALWDRYLALGLRLALWGWGSKAPLLEQFYRRPAYAAHSVVVVPGYFAECTGQRVLDALCDLVAIRTGSSVPTDLAARLAFVERGLAGAPAEPSRPCDSHCLPRLVRGGILLHPCAEAAAPTLLVVHTFDDPALHGDELFRQVFTLAAACAAVRIVISLDHAPNPEARLLAEDTDAEFLFLHTPTYVPYKFLETAAACRSGGIGHLASLAKARHTPGAGAGDNTKDLDHVIVQNTTTNTRKVLRLALDHFNQNGEDIALSELVRLAVRSLAAHDERGVLNLLQECLDHNVVTLPPGAAGDRLCHIVHPERVTRSLQSSKG